MRRIYAKVLRPKSIREGAEKFVKQVIGTRDYLAVHWRFDDSSLGSKIQSICGSMSKDDHVSSLKLNFFLIFSAFIRGSAEIGTKIFYRDKSKTKQCLLYF